MTDPFLATGNRIQNSASVQRCGCIASPPAAACDGIQREMELAHIFFISARRDFQSYRKAERAMAKSSASHGFGLPSKNITNSLFTRDQRVWKGGSMWIPCQSMLPTIVSCNCK